MIFNMIESVVLLQQLQTIDLFDYGRLINLLHTMNSEIIWVQYKQYHFNHK